MKCSTCGHEQETGKFCAKCGFEMTPPDNMNSTNTENQHVESEHAATTHSEKTYVPPNETSTYVDKAKKQTHKYLEYFTTFLRKPALIFSRSTNEVTNGIISSTIFSLIIALSMYIYTNRIITSFYGETNFFTLFFSSLIFIAISIAVVSLVLFLILKLFGPQMSYKQVLSIYGVHIIPAIFLALLSLLLLILEVNTSGLLITSIAVLYVLYAIPAYIISRLLVSQPKSLDPFYSYTLYIVGVTAAFYIVFKILEDSMIRSTIRQFMFF